MDNLATPLPQKDLVANCGVTLSTFHKIIAKIRKATLMKIRRVYRISETQS